MASRYQFKNIRGVEFGDFVIEFGDGKLMFFPKNNRAVHFTVNLQTSSGIIDVHKTTVRNDGQKSYETVFAMKQENLPIMLGEMSGLMTPETFRAPLRRLRFGWLRRQFMYLLAGQFPDEAQFHELSERNKRRRLELDVDRYSASLQPLVDYQDCIESESSVFGVFAVTKKLRAKQVGVAFKVFNTKTQRIEIQWLKLKDLSSSPVESAMRDFENIARKYEIPKEDYRHHDLS